MEHASGLLTIFVVFLAALAGGELANRLKLPSVVGQIVSGVVIGASGFNFVRPADMPVLNVLAELGAVFLLFAVGIETPFAKIGQVGAEAFRVAILGVLIPFGLGFAWAFLSGSRTPEAAFVASAFVATSAGITAKVLQDLGVIDRRFSRVILGAAVIDDVLAMLILTIVSTVAKGGSITVLDIAWTLFQAVGFIAILLLLGRKVVQNRVHILGKPQSALSPWSLSILTCLGISVLAGYLGLAAIIGSFLIGMILAETRYQEYIHEKLIDLNEFVVPFFFVVTGLSLNLKLLSSPKAMMALVVITTLAVIGKLAGGFWGAKQDRVLIGMGMVPRGEVGVIVAGLGKTFNVISESVYALLVAMSLLTSVIAAPIITKLVDRSSSDQTSDGSDDQT